MSPRQLRQQIEAIDRELGELRPWEKVLTTARKRYVLQAEREVVNLIDAGPRGREGRPPDPALEPFDDGCPGLRATRGAIAELRERRALLVEKLPSEAPTAERTREAEALATDIRTRAEDLATRTLAALAVLDEAARLTVAIAEDGWRLGTDNAALDKLTADADIDRPDTPRPDAPMFRVAKPLSVLLGGHFNGAQAWLDENLVRAIRSALEQ